MQGRSTKYLYSQHIKTEILTNLGVITHVGEGECLLTQPAMNCTTGRKKTEKIQA